MLSGKEKKVYYQNVFRVTLLISLSLITLIFYIFPRFNKISYNFRGKINIEIYVSDIPQTEQKKRGRPLPPRRPLSGLPVAVENAELPDEIILNEIPGVQFGEEGAGGVPVEVPARPLLEVYPDISEMSCRGYVSLLLLVNEKGKIESVEVLQNSTGSEKCLERAIQAAKKSLWTPARVNDKPVCSWVEKVYKFNING